jgi:hypothetical protein
MPAKTTAPSGGLRARIEAVLQPALAHISSLRCEGRHQGPRQRVHDVQIVAALIGLFVHLEGSLAQIMLRLYHMPISDSALSQRRARMGDALFEQIAQRVLGPLADATRHSTAFFKGLLLVGIDASKWSLPNTPANANAPKARTRRGAAAFAKLLMSTLVELASHAPLGAALSWQHSDEQSLSRQLLARLPQRCLLIVDRLYGHAPMLQELQTHTQAAQSHYLVRVRSKLAVSIQRTHADGSAEVQVSLRDRKRPRQQVAQLITREVRGRVWSRLQKQWVEVRLWTSLSCKQASAQQLIELYARRWEQELFFKELKLNLRHSQLVQSQTPQSAVQELLAMLMASRVLAEERLAVAAQSQQAAVEAACAVRVSFAKCRVHMLGLWITLSAGEGILSQRQQEQLIDAVRAQIVREALPKRRSRSCDRKLRQPVRKWPRMMKPVSLNSPLKFEVTKIT